MVTYDVFYENTIRTFSSEPTVWDGDALSWLMRSCGAGYVGSKPTAWDGDFLPRTRKPLFSLVLSPPCGMVTVLDFVKWSDYDFRSKPTAWDSVGK